MRLSSQARGLREHRIRGLVTVWTVATRLFVSAPYNDAFKSQAGGLKGRYKHRLRVWSFPRSAQEEVRGLVELVYGPQQWPEYLATNY